MTEVSGRVVIDAADDANAAARGTVYVRLVDTSEADAPAKLVRELVIADVRLDQLARDGVPFRLSADVHDPNATYTIQALVDCDGDGEIGPGDFFTVESCPVLTHGYPHSDVVVHARRIG